MVESFSRVYIHFYDWLIMTKELLADIFVVSVFLLVCLVTYSYVVFVKLSHNTDERAIPVLIRLHQRRIRNPTKPPYR